MPDFFSTGNPQWNQGFNTLASALFPDPSRVAQAGLAGAQTGQILQQRDQLAAQMAAQQQFQQLIAGGGAPSAPPVAPGPSLADTVTGGGGAAGGAVPGAAAGGAPLPSPPPTPVPTTVSSAPPATTTPPSGVPPAPIPQGPPTGGAPATSPLTGAIIPAATAAGIIPPASALHPGSMTDPGGGEKQSGPAAPNGSPAPLALDIPKMMALGVAAGYSPEALREIGGAAVSKAYQSGQIDLNTANQILASIGNAAPLQVQAESQRAAAGLGERKYEFDTGATKQYIVNGQVQSLTDQQARNTPGAKPVELDLQQATLTEKQREFDTGATHQYVVNGQVQTLTDQAARNTPGATPYDETLNRTNSTLALYVLPDGSQRMMTAQQASQIAGARPAVAGSDEAYGDYTNPKVPGSQIHTTALDARNRGLVELPTSTDAQRARANAQGFDAALNKPPGPDGQPAPPPTPADIYGAQQSQTPPAQLTPVERGENDQLIDKGFQAFYQPTNALGSRAEPPAMGPLLRAEITQRVEAMRVAGNWQQRNMSPEQQTQIVMQQMAQNHELPTNEEARGSGFGAMLSRQNPYSSTLVYPRDKNGRQVPSLQIELQTPSLSNTVAPTPPAPTPPAPTPPAPTPPAPTPRVVPGVPVPSPAVTPPPNPPGTPPPGAIGQAPPGTPEGARTTYQGKPVVNRGGFVYVVTPGQ